MTARLLALPVELLHAIIDELLPKYETNDEYFKHDIKSPRLVCRELQTKARKALALRFFEHIVIDVVPPFCVFDPGSMDDPIFQDSVRALSIYLGGQSNPLGEVAA
jgi:hypothetical protein